MGVFGLIVVVVGLGFVLVGIGVVDECGCLVCFVVFRWVVVWVNFVF